MAMSRALVQVHDADFVFAHGHAPRGRGSWAFLIGSKKAEPTWIPGSVTFSEAKRQAVKLAAERGFANVWVCS